MTKIKNIYHIITDMNDDVHCHVNPVIYMNSKYVYFKVHGTDLLECINISKIHDNLDLPRSQYIMRERYCWNQPSDVELNNMRRLCKAGDYKRRIISHENRVKELQDQLDSTLLKLKSMYDEYNALIEENSEVVQ